jgi:TonB family protein
MKANIKRLLMVAALAIPAAIVTNAVYAQTRANTKDKDPEPEFVGGKPELQRYLDANLKYPAQAKNAKKEGVVYISFTVAESGKIENPKVVRSIGYGCDEEALRLVSEMPNWVPGKEEGITKALPVVIPISFRL